MQAKKNLPQFAVIKMQKSGPSKFFTEAWMDNNQLHLNECLIFKYNPL